MPEAHQRWNPDHPNSAAANAVCVCCGNQGAEHIVRTSLRVIPNTLCTERELLCKSCRKFFRFSLDSWTRISVNENMHGFLPMVGRPGGRRQTDA